MAVKNKIEKILILHNLRSIENVGSLFRTADAAGVTRMMLVGTTPTPVDRFGRSDKRLAKTALGAEQSVPWEYHKNIVPVLRRLRTQNVFVIAVEQSEKSVLYTTVRPRGSWACVVGNEVLGLPLSILRVADAAAVIPMSGAKESLNVTVAAGIVLFRLRDQ